jgi:large subunit ribosomal protein L28
MNESGDLTMTKVCQVTGKRPTTGNNVSHAKNRTRRRFLPNLHKRRIFIPSENRYITLRVSAKGLRLIDKLGIEAVLEKMKKKESVTGVSTDS